MAQLAQSRCFSDTVVLGCGKSNRGNYILTTNVEINVQDIEIIPTIRLLVIGGAQVGKTALTVRYLTKRLATTESIQSDFYYRQCIHLEGRRPVEIEIIDISSKPGEIYNLPIHRLRESDAIIAMYSITDRRSYESAKDIMDIISDLEPSIPTPMLLFGNKTDLNHLRKISSYEGERLAQRYNASFHEISVADSPTDTVSILTSVVKELWHTKTDYSNDEFKHKRWGSVSGISSSRSRHRRADEEDDYEDYENILPPHVSDHKHLDESSLLAPSSVSDDPRIRKPSVFDVSRRVFNNLMGRNSLPPELPSSNTSKQSSMSLKNVFKKRSV
uniref:small monomeric GTPase n=1 Tax=Lepeophtheirus salmonis TaxID=72036 RepID=D3PGP1_LEPSM|nr:Ras-like protein family member 11B [Lepeophtheirus salmonis]